MSRAALAAVFALVFSLVLMGCAGYTAPTSNPTTPTAVIALSALSFDFKSVTIGQSLTQTLHITNSGTGPLTVSSLSVSNKEFAFTGPSLPRTVLPNMGLDYTLSFTPTTSGSAAAALTIVSDASNSIPAISLSGVGNQAPASASMSISPGFVGFGNVTVQTTSSKTISLQNTGGVNITISGITVVGSNFGFTDLSPGYTLAPNQTVTFQVWFKPTFVGGESATLSILSANVSSPASTLLNGYGQSSTTDPTPPPPVQHTVHLSWKASPSSVIGYRVYRGDKSGGPYAPVASSVSGVSYDDSTVDSGSTYYYVVTAVDATGEESTDSNQAKAVVPTP